MLDRLVTVFGGSGFVGRYVVKRLAEQGWRVRVAVRRPDEALFLKPMGVVGQIVPTQANLRMPSSVAAAVAGADAVINLVGLLYESGAQSFAAVHARGAGTVAREAVAAGVGRLVHVSALGADAGSASAYARSKAAGEAAVREQFPDAAVLRPSVIFGPEDDFFNRFAGLARVLPALPLIDGGHSRLQPVYVGDVAEAVVRVLDRPEARGQLYELGGPRVYTFAELMRLVLDQTGRHRLLLPLPAGLARFGAFFCEFLPSPPLTRDQITLAGQDNVVGSLPGLADLGIPATPVDAVLPSYLFRYRRRGGSVGERLKN